MPQRTLGSPTKLLSCFKYDVYLTDPPFLKKTASGKRNKLDYE